MYCITIFTIIIYFVGVDTPAQLLDQYLIIFRLILRANCTYKLHLDYAVL